MQVFIRSISRETIPVMIHIIIMRLAGAGMLYVKPSMAGVV